MRYIEEREEVKITGRVGKIMSKRFIYKITRFRKKSVKDGLI